MNSDRASGADGLSEAGAARREAILAGLHQRLDARLRRRRAARTGLGAAAALGLAAVVWLPRPEMPAGGTGPAEVPIGHTLPENPAPSERTGAGAELATAGAARVMVRIVSTPSLDLAPCQNSRAAGVCLLSDEQLLAALAEAGRPSGLVRVGGRAAIVPRDAGLGDPD